LFLNSYKVKPWSSGIRLAPQINAQSPLAVGRAGGSH
jgi:hypothetical protein